MTVKPDAQAIQHVLCLIDEAIERKKRDVDYAVTMTGSEMLHSLYMVRIWLNVEQNYALEEELKDRKQVLKQETEPVFEA
jgi:hypothetical protein